MIAKHVSTNLQRTTLVITASLLFAIVGICALGIINRYYAQKGRQQTETVTSVYLPNLATLAKLEKSALVLNTITLEFALGKDAESMQALTATFDDEIQTLNREIGTLKGRVTDTQSPRLIQDFAQASKKYAEASGKFRESMESGDFVVAMELLDTEVSAGRSEVESALEKLLNHTVSLSTAESASTRELLDQLVKMGTVSAGAIIALTIAAGFFSIIATRRIAARLRLTSQNLEQSTSIVRSRSEHLSKSSTRLADGASHQAATIEETSASIQEIVGSTERNATDASESKEISEKTRNEAEDCASRMSEMRIAMDEVKQSSDKISRIIQTIDEIAFQTNILALNAAVEAARAGESGAGFAVVADEVRALAQRSAQAARETSVTIEDALQRTERGVNLTESVAEGLESMVEHTRKVNELMSRISAACDEQNVALVQLKAGVDDINKATQDTALTAEAESEASKSLRAQSDALSEGIEDLLRAIGGKRMKSVDTSLEGTGPIQGSSNNFGPHVNRSKNQVSFAKADSTWRN